MVSQIKSPIKSRSASPLPDWLSQSSTPSKPLEILDESDDDGDTPNEPTEAVKAVKASKQGAKALHKQEEDVSKANGLKRGRAILQTSSDSEGCDAEAPSHKRSKTATQSQKSVPTPARSSKPGKLQQKGITAFLTKPEANSAVAEDHLAEDAKHSDPAQASQTQVRQQHVVMMHSP